MLVPPILSALLTAVVLALLVPWLRRHQVLDVPNDRSSHQVPVPRGAGAALVLGVAGSGLYLWDGVSDRAPVILAGVAVIVAFGVLGFVDDVRSLSATSRLVVQLVLAAAAVGVLVTWGPADHAVPLLVLVGTSALCAGPNVVNFMDGIDGITALWTVATGAALAVVAAGQGLPGVAVLAACVGASALAFLPWNVTPARAFLGDVGSYALGAGLAWCALTVWAAGAPGVAVLSTAAVYLADTGWALVRRLLHGEPVLQAHRGHVYQRLVDRGWSHLAVATAVTACSAAAAAAGIVSTTVDGIATVIMIGVGCLVVGGYLAAPRWLTAATERRLRSAAEAPRPADRVACGAQGTADTVRLLGSDVTVLGEVARATLGTRAGLALSRGRFPKPEVWLDPNEDAVLVARHGERWLLAAVDGHRGFDAARSAVEAVAAVAGEALLDGGDGVDVVTRIVAQARAAVAAALSTTQESRRKSRTALTVLLVHPGCVYATTCGDSSAFRLRAGRVEALTPATPFLGPHTPPPAVSRASLLPGDGLVAVTDGFTDFLGAAIGPTLRCQLTGDDPGRVADALVRAAFAGGAGDNVGVVVLLPPDRTAGVRPLRPARGTTSYGGSPADPVPGPPRGRSKYTVRRT